LQNAMLELFDQPLNASDELIARLAALRGRTPVDFHAEYQKLKMHSRKAANPLPSIPPFRRSLIERCLAD